MAIAACLFAMSSVFVACSDDDSTTMGAVPVNSCQVTGTTVNVVWSIVPNEKCGGYEVSLIQGNRDGAVIETKTLDNRTCKASFTGLTPNTRYTIKTQAIPGKGFSAAEPYYRADICERTFDASGRLFFLYEAVKERTYGWTSVPGGRTE